MKFSIAAKLASATILFHVGVVSRKLRGYHGGNCVILAYHRIIPKSWARNGVEAGMYVEPETLETHIQFLKKYFNVIPLPELSWVGSNNSRHLHGKPLCVLTFDDGWFDFYQQAYPLLRAHKIPATLFLPTAYIGSLRTFWTDRLSQILRQGKSLKILVQRVESRNNPLMNQLGMVTGSLESQMEKAISILKGYRGEQIEAALSELSAGLDKDSTPSDRSFLTWKEVKEMRDGGLISFGSHTASHRILTTLTAEEIWNELISSKETLIARGAVDPSFMPFCYPNGNYNGEILNMVKEAGYHLALTTKKGWNNNGTDPFALRRVSIHQDMTSTESMLACRILGIL